MSRGPSISVRKSLYNNVLYPIDMIAPARPIIRYCPVEQLCDGQSGILDHSRYIYRESNYVSRPSIHQPS